MKRVLFIIALLCLGVVACRKTETAESVNVNNAPARAAAVGSGGHTAPAAGQTNTNQTNEATAQVKSPLPPPTGHVNDYAHVIDDKTKQRLEKTLDNLRQRAHIEFAVVTVKTTGREAIYDYSLATARGWGVVAEPGGDGLLLMVAIEDRSWQIQVSRSLEDELPDGELAQLGRLLVEPFRAGKYGEGLTKCVEAIIERLSKKRGFENKDEEETMKAERGTMK